LQKSERLKVVLTLGMSLSVDQWKKQRADGYSHYLSAPIKRRGQNCFTEDGRLIVVGPPEGPRDARSTRILNIAEYSESVQAQRRMTDRDFIDKLNQHIIAVFGRPANGDSWTSSTMPPGTRYLYNRESSCVVHVPDPGSQAYQSSYLEQTSGIVESWKGLKLSKGNISKLLKREPGYLTGRATLSGG
jgi:hypothetical protein